MNYSVIMAYYNIVIGIINDIKRILYLYRIILIAEIVNPL